MGCGPATRPAKGSHPPHASAREIGALSELCRAKGREWTTALQVSRHRPPRPHNFLADGTTATDSARELDTV